MKKGKIIVIEGTDCSGKETQSKRLIQKLNDEGMETVYYSFPAYGTPTGRIVGLSYLGKPYLAKELVYSHIKEVKAKLKQIYQDKYNDEIVDKVIETISEELGCGWFKEGAPNVEAKISSLYYAADRAYNAPIINSLIEEGKNVILDRYIFSNLAHQGGKIEDRQERKEMYKWNCNLEFNMLSLPKSDVRLFLHMPTEYATFLRRNREEKLDENERDVHHLLNAEKAYIEIANMFDFTTIECVRKEHKNVVEEDIKTKEEISEEVYSAVTKKLNLR